MYSISKLCQASGLSRSTLLYYDSIDLLKPSGRTASNYRLYSEEDQSRLAQICAYREAGVSLEQIKELLRTEGKDDKDILIGRLSGINNELYLLRLQQKIIIEMLKNKQEQNQPYLLDKNTFVSLLKSSGMSDQSLAQLHVEFERHSPTKHQAFLEYLGIDQEDIRLIRECGQKLL
jgi:DNA-binding transcriptional MerR regulator